MKRKSERRTRVLGWDSEKHNLRPGLRGMRFIESMFFRGKKKTLRVWRQQDRERGKA